MSKIIKIIVGCLMICSIQAYAQVAWFDDELNAVDQTKATLYIKELPQKQEGLWPIVIYSTVTNLPIIEGKLTNPELKKLTFKDNKWFYFCPESNCKQERKRINNDTIEIWVYNRENQLFSHLYAKNNKVEGKVTYYKGKPNPVEITEYKNGVKHGKEQYLNQNGSIYYEALYKNGKREGLMQRWSDNGKLYEQTMYQNDQLNGLSKEWSSSWIEQVNYKNSKKDGVLKRWNYRDKLIAEMTYKEDVLDGLSTYYTEDGVLAKRVLYKQDKKVAEEYYYREQGKLQSKVKYSDNNELIKTVSYYPTGKIKEHNKITYQNTMKTEVKVSYYENGKMQAKSENKQDRQNKFYSRFSEYFDKQGKLTDRSEYINNQKNGLFMESGRSKLIENYKLGQLHGEYLYLDENNNILEKGNYKEGKKIGPWQEESFIGRQQVYTFANYNELEELDGSYLIKDAQGKILIKGAYLNNKKIGQWQDYEYGMFCHGQYQNNHPVELRQCYADNGQLLSSIYYDQQGKKQGNAYYFSHAGLLEEVFPYKNDRAEGKAKKYNEDGKVEITHYKNGQQQINN